ncbi:MAG: aldo/keto reductase [Rhodobacteraceae bacterium]|nr:aldo/keto reductase [Paracoccaceae bacterium]
MTHRPLIAPDGSAPSRFCFGTMQFGGAADARESRAMYDAARAAGINFFDTAYLYTGGESERLLGQFAASEREKLIIATKCAHPGPATAEVITREFDESRRRLGMDHVDILYIHKWCEQTPLQDSLRALARLVDDGAIGHVGLSNFAAWQVMKAAGIAADMGLSITILQPMYNLLKRQAEVEILPMAMAEGMLVAPYSPLAGGMLTGKYQRGEEGRFTTNAQYRARYAPAWMEDGTRAFVALAREIGVSPATLAVAWVAHHPGISAPIISARSAEQLRPSLLALDVALPDDLHARISDLVPRPAPATDRLEELAG